VDFVMVNGTQKAVPQERGKAAKGKQTIPTNGSGKEKGLLWERIRARLLCSTIGTVLRTHGKKIKP